jgi:hypothetical protein
MQASCPQISGCSNEIWSFQVSFKVLMAPYTRWPEVFYFPLTISINNCVWINTRKRAISGLNPCRIERDMSHSFRKIKKCRKWCASSVLQLAVKCDPLFDFISCFAGVLLMLSYFLPARCNRIFTHPQPTRQNLPIKRRPQCSRHVTTAIMIRDGSLRLSPV